MRFVIDYSSFYFHEGNVTGIPRTVESLSTAIKQVSDLPVEYVVIDEYDESFKYFSPNEKKVIDKYIPKSDDNFLCLGAPWKHACYLHAISDIKDTIHAFILLVYDLIPYLFPHFYIDPKFGEYYISFISKIISQANKVFCISKNTYDDLIRLVKDESIESKTSVIKLGSDFSKPEEKTNKSLSDLEIPSKYILCVGTIEFRKNQNFLLKVYRKILQDSKDFPSLILAGKVGFGDNQIEHQIVYDPILRGNVKILNCLTDGDLDLLYKHSLFTVYPSLYEGWGLPICESLMHGKNVVCSNTSSMIEIAPDLCHFADPLNYNEWFRVMLLLSTDSNYRQLKEQKIVYEYKPVHWNDTAHFLLETLN